MSTAYVKTHLSGRPSPGGVGIIFASGHLPLIECSHVLPRTSPLIASVTAIRETLLEAPHAAPLTLIHENFKATELLAERKPTSNPVLSEVVRQINDIIFTRKLSVTYLERGGLDIHHENARRLAVAAFERAWLTTGAITCPRCKEPLQLSSDHTVWQCRTPHCGHQLLTYQGEQP